jgi:outer membrane protein assembly factor BamB
MNNLYFRYMRRYYSGYFPGRFCTLWEMGEFLMVFHAQKKILVVLLAVQFLIMVCAAETVTTDDPSASDSASATQLNARFAADVTSGKTPLTVQFTDKSTGKPTSWNWDFGDGSRSTDQNPVHSYSKTGKFTVVLNVVKGTKSNQMKKTDMITVRVDKAPPPGITRLRNTTFLKNSITWTWVDPSPADFSLVMVYLDNTFTQNVTRGIQTCSASGLKQNTRHTISTRTVDITGNLNKTWVNHTAWTSIPSLEPPAGWMFRGNPAHTGVYDDGGIHPTGQLKWKYTTGDWVESSPAVANGIVYVGSRDHNLYALDADTGALIWKYTTGGEVFSSPAVADGIVYAGSVDNNLYTLNASTGALIWKYTTGGEVLSSPAVANGVVYAGSIDNNLYALNVTTGALIWKYKTGDWVQSSPAVADGVVYVGSNDGKLYALNASTGTLAWKYTSNLEIRSSPAVSDGVVYVGSMDHNLYALNANNGKLIWRYLTGDPVYSSPAVVNGVVYGESMDHNLSAFDAATGALIWNYAIGTGITVSSPAVANGVVYGGGGDGKLYALNASTGSLVWNYTSNLDIRSSPTIANGVVYVGSYDGNLYAIQ